MKAKQLAVRVLSVLTVESREKPLLELDDVCNATAKYCPFGQVTLSKSILQHHFPDDEVRLSMNLYQLLTPTLVSQWSGAAGAITHAHCILLSLVFQLGWQPRCYIKCRMTAITILRRQTRIFKKMIFPSISYFHFALIYFQYFSELFKKKIKKKYGQR